MRRCTVNVHRAAALCFATPTVPCRAFTSSVIIASRSKGKFSLAKRGNPAITDKKQETTEDPSNVSEVPVRTRFAPSPTGFLHLGSLRTLLYNYLYARSSGGKFLLRLEDTDQKRLVEGAEQNIYDNMKWLTVTPDEGPGTFGGDYGPYRQSDRSEIYAEHAKTLLDNGSAYRCFCSKERLDNLRQTAMKLNPPTTVTYDRHCLKNISREESDQRAAKGEEFTVRFVSPDVYPEFQDLLHGTINHQPQVNHYDRRYDDFIILKSDLLPTYHFANVVDDHLMLITHVIRGEEWLASTAKHIALYNSFGWKYPEFVHIPLLTSLNNKKLSKRSGDISVDSLRRKGYLPEALINFSVFFGWAPKRNLGEISSEQYTLKELEKLFSIDGLTAGNAKVDFSKLDYFNKNYLTRNLQDPKFFEEAVQSVNQLIMETHGIETSRESVAILLENIGSALTTLNELASEKYLFFFKRIVNYNESDLLESLKSENLNGIVTILKLLSESNDEFTDLNKTSTAIMEAAAEELNGEKLNKKFFYQTLRFALTNQTSGANLPFIISFLKPNEVKERISQCYAALKAK